LNDYGTHRFLTVAGRKRRNPAQHVAPLRTSLSISRVGRMRSDQRVGVILAACFICNAGARCQKPGGEALRVGQQPATDLVVRNVRILLVEDQPQVRFSMSGPYSIRDNSGTVPGDVASGPITVTADAKRGVAFGNRILGPGEFDIVPERGSVISLSRREGRNWTGPRLYPGVMRISLDDGGRLRVVNHVDIETYVACVLPGEMPARFHHEAQRAQTVAIRTYVLYEMATRPHRPYDVRATEASQVYHGLPADYSRARAITDATRGIVGTWSSPDGERVLCTFYSSCCGGMTQNVSNIKRTFAPTPPLAGGVRCDCYKSAKGKTYRWSAASMSKSEVTSKLVARYPELGKLGRIERISVLDRTQAGRPKLLELVGAGGGSARIISEDFRLAVGSRVLRSTQCDIRNEPERFVFANGRGFGHGVGMCQWGAEAMAQAGERAGTILKHYYPTMHLTRAY